MKRKLHYMGLPILIGALLPNGVHAESAGVPQLLSQAEYWQGKGRGDLARQAYNRVLTIDPANARARAALNGQAPTPKTVTAPAPKAPVAKPVVQAAAPAAAPAPRAAAAAAAAAAPRPASKSASAPARADRGGADRAAGFDALDANKLSVASTRFKRALSVNGSDADALGGLGLVRLRTSDFAEAEDFLARASRIGDKGKWAEALTAARFYAGVEGAKAALTSGDLARAQQLAEAQAQSGYRDSNIAIAVLASVYERQGRYTEAADLYRRLGQSGGSGSQAAGSALRAQAQAALQAGDDVQAEQLLRQGLATTPDDPWIAHDLAGLFRKEGRPAESDALVRQLAYSEKPDSLFAAALILNGNGRPSDARNVMTRVPAQQRTKEMRDFAASLDALATAESARGMAARGAQGQAIATLRQAASNPNLSADAKGALAQAMLDTGDSMGAVQTARDALSAPANSPAAYQSIVRVLVGAGQDGLARTAIQKAAATAGQSADGQATVARLNATLATAQADRLRQSGQFAPAFDILQSAWGMAPGDQDILEAFARLYQAGGLHEQAVQSWRMILGAKPGDKAAMLGLADSAAAAGDTDTASKAIDQAMRSHPDDYEVLMAAARVARARGNTSQSTRYLKAAREIYLRGTMGMDALSAGQNPFANAPQSANPFGTQPQQQQQRDNNPFRSGGFAPQLQPQSQPLPLPGTGFDAGGYTPPLPSNYQTNAAPTGYPALKPASFSAQEGMFLPPAMPTAGRPIYPAAAVSADAPGVPPYTYGYNTPANPTDPVLMQIDQELAKAAGDGARVDVQTGFRSRSGETGLSRLRELSGAAQVSAPFAGGRVSAKAQAIVLDAGRPTGSGLARFGANALPEAIGIVAKLPSQLAAADTQHASGVALSASYENKIIKAEVGTTPLGFAKNHITGRVELTPRLSQNATARLWADRKPVTDSIVAYAGTTDPLTGAFWGSVMKSGGGASLSYDKSGSGVYADVSWYHYDGTAVRDNTSIEANVGGYLEAWKGENAGLTVGINANYQNYDNNQNYFTYGHGGYFSPQSFLSVNFPVRYWSERGPLRIDAGVAPGYQSYDQQSEAVFPTEPGVQGVLNFLKSQNTDVRSRYDSISKTGFGLSASASAYYAINPRTKVGGELNLNTFGEYKEFRSLVGIKQSIGGK